MASTAKGGQNTFAEGLGKILQDLGGLMSTPDADLDFLQKMQLVLATKIRQMVNQAIPSKPAGGPGGMGSPPGMPGNPAAGGQPGGPMLAGPPGPAGQGISPLAQAPNPDELRRVIGAGASQ